MIKQMKEQALILVTDNLLSRLSIEVDTIWEPLIKTGRMYKILPPKYRS